MLVLVVGLAFGRISDSDVLTLGLLGLLSCSISLLRLLAVDAVLQESFHRVFSVVFDLSIVKLGRSSTASQGSLLALVLLLLELGLLMDSLGR